MRWYRRIQYNRRATYSVHPSATSSPESPPAMDVDAVLAYTANVIAAVRRKTGALRFESFPAANMMCRDVFTRRPEVMDEERRGFQFSRV